MSEIHHIIERMKLAESLGISLCLYRHKKEMSQMDLSAAIDIERSTISAIENGRNNISLINFMRLCEGLETDPREILDDTLKRMGK